MHFHCCSMPHLPFALPIRPIQLLLDRWNILYLFFFLQWFHLLFCTIAFWSSASSSSCSSKWATCATSTVPSRTSTTCSYFHIYMLFHDSGWNYSCQLPKDRWVWRVLARQLGFWSMEHSLCIFKWTIIIPRKIFSAVDCSIEQISSPWHQDLRGLVVLSSSLHVCQTHPLLWIDIISALTSAATSERCSTFPQPCGCYYLDVCLLPSSES